MKINKNGIILPFSLLSVALMLVVVNSACRSEMKKNGEGEVDIVTETPPSIRGGEQAGVVVQINETEISELSIQTYTVSRAIHKYNLNVPGVVFPSPGHNSVISTPLPGRVVEIKRREGDPVRKGEILFRIESLELGVLVSDYIQAVAEEEYYQSRFERIRQLSEKQISSASERDKAESDLKRARTITRAAYGKLRTTGIPDIEIKNFIRQDNIEPILNLRAPIDGVFDQRKVELGQSVSAYEALGSVIDNRFVLVRGYLSPEDGRLVQPGDSVWISRRNQAETRIGSQVSTVSPGLDETNRSAVVNIFLKIIESWPRPGENVRLTIQVQTPEELIVVPLRAITYNGNNPVVFVQKGPGTWEERKIAIRETRENNAIVLSGLMPGEKVAVSQVFSLKALARYEQISEE